MGYVREKIRAHRAQKNGVQKRHGEPTDRELRKRAEDLLNSGLCRDGTLYHVTQTRRMADISQEGLKPSNSESATFDAYSAWSQGKLFLAGGEEAAAEWALTIARNLTPRTSGAWATTWTSWVEQAEQLVLLRVVPSPGVSKRVLEDWQGNDTHECSFYTTKPIPAKWLEYAVKPNWRTVFDVAAGRKEDFSGLMWSPVVTWPR